MRIKARFQEWTISLLERRYSGIREVVSLLDKVRENVENQEIVGLQDDTEDTKEEISNHDSSGENGSEVNEVIESEKNSVFKPDDGKWRPVLATLGLIYKLQKVSDDDWYDNPTVFMQDKEKAGIVINRMAFFWHRFMKTASSISGDEEEELKKNMAEEMELPPEDVLFVYNKDAKKAAVEEHCPDIAVTLDRERKEVVLTVAGTKVFPAPSAADIIMDLYAEAVPFHKGRAHRGMAMACENILAKVLDIIITALDDLKDFKLIVVGYSLGAGVAQLLGLRLSEGPEHAKLPEGTEMLTITFGSPPVYLSSEPGYVNPSIISVYNHNDGLASLSLHTVTRLFLHIRAINRLCLGRRHTIRLLRSKLGKSTIENGTRRYLAIPAEQRIEGWESITTGMDAVDKSGFSRLTHFAGITYLLKKADLTWAGGEVGHVVRRLEGGQAAPLARELRLRAGMFNDHMPWGYAGLFKGCKGDDGGIGITDLIKYI